MKTINKLYKRVPFIMKHWLFAPIVLMAVASSANAAVMYNYSGNNYSYVETGNFFTTSENVTGYFSVDAALSANLNNQELSGFSGFDFQFNDGGFTFKSSDIASSALNLTQFLVTTDASGNVVGWDIAMSYVGFGPYVPAQPYTLSINSVTGDEAFQNTGNACDPAIISGCVPYNYDIATAVSKVPSGATIGQIAALDIWATSPGVPEPATLALIGFGLLGIALSRKKKVK